MTDPHAELMQRVELSIQALTRSNFARDARRKPLEKKKVILLALILISMWVIFFLLRSELHPTSPSPEPLPVPVPAHDVQAPTHYQILEQGEPVYAI
jgi:hypothetical protein